MSLPKSKALSKILNSIKYEVLQENLCAKITK